MKKILIILLVIMLVTILTACGGSDNFAQQSNYIHDILAIRNSDGGIIYYGMNRADVESILGLGERGTPRHIVVYGDEISILYRDDIVVSIILSNGSEWRLANGAYVGMQVNNQTIFYNISLEEKRQFINSVMNFASQTEENVQITIVDYRFVLEGDSELRLVTTVEEFGELFLGRPEQDIMRSSFIISFSIPDDTVAGIILGDMQALLTFR